MNWVEQKYNSFYKQLDFERKGLFRFLFQFLGNKNVLYPGSSFHITPSFYFKKVTYLDNSAEVAKFFGEAESVQRIINKEKQYREDCTYNFYQLDFNQDNAPLNQEYDLLLSLFAGRMVHLFLPFLRSGAYILTSDQFSDLEFVQSRNYKLIGVIRADKKNSYSFTRENKQRISKKQTRNYTFKDNLNYYLFEFHN